MAAKTQTGDIPALHAAMLVEMDVVLASIASLADPVPAPLQPNESASADSTTSQDKTVDLPAFANAVAALQEHLLTGDVDAIQDSLTQCRNAGVPPEIADAFAKLEHFTDAFCYPEALEVLNLLPPSFTSASEG